MTRILATHKGKPCAVTRLKHVATVASYLSCRNQQHAAVSRWKICYQSSFTLKWLRWESNTQKAALKQVLCAFKTTSSDYACSNQCETAALSPRWTRTPVAFHTEVVAWDSEKDESYPNWPHNACLRSS